jgi:hypothetical protein
MDDPSSIVAEQEATIQRIKERLLMWADILEERCSVDPDAERALREMRETAKQL